MRKMKPSGVEWIGDICSSYKMYRLKHLLRSPLMYGANESGDPFDERLPRYIRITDITMDGVLKESGKLSLNEEAASGYILEDNDLLFARSGASVGKVFIYKKTYGRSAFAGYLIKASVNDLILPDYLFLYTQSSIYEEWKKQIFIQSTIQNIGADRYNNLIVVCPPLPEQQRIAEFLDRKCAEIDSVMSKTKATIEQYKALKQSVITQAVTKGIRPDRQMKDSGIEWIGEIPQEWSKDKVFRAFSTIGSGTTPKSSDESNYEGNINWIQSGDINGRILSEVKNRLSIEAIDKYSALRIYTSPFIVIAMYGASIGNISISKIDSCVNQACCVLAEPKININYAFQSIKAAKNYLITKAVGGGQPNISQDIVKSLWLPIPPLLEQQEIADYLDRKCAEIDRLIAAKEQLLTELESYKKSVIYEYVTGKKEV